MGCFVYKIIISAAVTLLILTANAVSGTPNTATPVFDSKSEPLNKSQYTPNVAAKITTEKVFQKTIIGHPYLSVMIGAGFAKIGEQQLDTTGEITDGQTQYLPNKKNYYGSPVYGINGGYEFKLGSNGLLSLGIGLYESSNYNSKGQVWQKNEYAGINIHTLDYEYKVQSTRLMLETQLSWQFDLNKIKLAPFILLGAGSSLNFANSYEEKVVDVNSDAKVPGFGSNRNTNFAYQLGAGIAIPFNNEHDRFFVAYKYVDLGRARFNIRPGDPFLYQLNVGRIKTNEVGIGYTRLFDF